MLISPSPDPTEKQLKGRHFSSDAEVIAATETWLDGQPYELFLSGLQKFSLVAIACFFPGRAKDFTTPRYVTVNTNYATVYTVCGSGYNVCDCE